MFMVHKSLFARKRSPFITVLSTRYSLHVDSLSYSLSIFISNEPQNLCLYSGNVLQTDFWFRLFLWAMYKDHFAWLLWVFCVRFTRSVMFEHSVNKRFGHCLYHVYIFPAWIETSIKLSIFGFLLKMSKLSVVEITSCVYTKTIIRFNFGE